MTPAQEVIRGRIAAIDGELEDIERQRQAALDLRRELAELEAAIAPMEPVRADGVPRVNLTDVARLMFVSLCCFCENCELPGKPCNGCDRKALGVVTAALPSLFVLRKELR